MNASTVLPLEEIPLTVKPATHPVPAAQPSAETWWRHGFRRFLRWFLVRICGVKATGLERLPCAGGVIVAPNHLSYTDCLLLGALSPRPVRFMGTHHFLPVSYTHLTLPTIYSV